MKKGKADFRQFKAFAARVEKANTPKVIDEHMANFLIKLGNYGLSKVKKKQYGIGAVDTTHMVKNWYITEVVRRKGVLYLTLYNNVKYASYVENGHRTRLGTGKAEPKEGGVAWVDGRFMLALSIKEIQKELPKLQSLHQRRFLEGLING